MATTDSNSPTSLLVFGIEMLVGEDWTMECYDIYSSKIQAVKEMRRRGGSMRIVEFACTRQRVVPDEEQATRILRQLEEMFSEN